MNSCMFVGNIGADAELAQAGNSQVCKFSIGSSAGFGDKKTTMWVTCNLWGKRGQSLAQYLLKGSKVMVVGELSENEYNGKTYKQLNVNQIELLDSRESSAAQQPVQQYAQQKPAAQQYGQQQQPAAQQGQSEFNPFDGVNGQPF